MPATPLHAAFAALPREIMAEGSLSRSGVRTEGSLAVFNWIEPGMPSLEPHSHPFDQLALILEGTAEFDLGTATYTVGSGELLYIPADVPHTLRVVGTETVLNVDIFSPAREDYLHLTEHQPA